MAVTLTIIGLGQIGTSIGLALNAQTHLLTRRGYDKQLGVTRKAEKMGALDKVYINLPNAVRDADIVLMALPLHEIRATLEIILPDLKEGAVVMDTSPVKGALAQWAADLLPAERYYIGLTPVINPNYLQTPELGQDAARPDLFQNSPMLIAAPPNTASTAVKLAADLTRLLQATPLFVDLAEIDSLMASTDTLPKLIAAALVNATVNQPGWHEGRKLAGRAYTEATAPVLLNNDPQALRNSALLNQQNVLRALDSFMGALQTLREDIANQNANALDERLLRAHENREHWWKQRFAADWTLPDTPKLELPNASEVFSRLLGINRRKPIFPSDNKPKSGK